MVKTKQQKCKPKGKPHVKKHGKQADVSQFRAQLDTLELKIIQVTADGNCFFRALADQLEGNEEAHEKYRNMVVQYITKNREMFEPFIEDDIPFEEYCKSMEKDGTWAGHMELQAASLVTRSNICIHRYMSPRWYIRNFDQVGARMVHLSYHDEEHYNSVRLKDDPCDGPAKPIRIKADANLSEASHQAKAVNSKSIGGTAKDIDTGSIKLVMAGSGCENAEKVKEVLLQVDGDVDSAIEFMIADQETNDYSLANDSVCAHEDASYDCQKDSDGDVEQQKEDPVELTNKHNSSKTTNVNSTRLDEKKIPRNKVCPCGSKKKYKACCGAVIGRSATTIVVNPIVNSTRGKKERKQSKRGSANSAPSCNSDDGMLDVGALCI